MVERERRWAEQDDKVSLQVLVDMLRAAIVMPIASIREVAMRQVERMAAQLKQQYGYLGVLKNNIIDAPAGINDVPTAQHQDMIAWAERLSN